MRSAIYYPHTEILSEETMRTALLMWDEIHAIVPWPEYAPDYRDNKPLAEAWELFGRKMVPDSVQKKRAHNSIKEMLEAGISINDVYRDNISDREVYEIYPEKLDQETWSLLQNSELAGKRLANGDYPFQEQAGIAIMAKLADACAGSSFARCTDRFLAYGLVPDRETADTTATDVVPLTLSLIDSKQISLEDLVKLRQREKNEALGHDYKKMRHAYSDAISAHIERLKTIQGENELKELNRQFEEKMEADVRELRKALGSNISDTLLAPVIVSSVVAAGSWLATHDLSTIVTSASAALAASSASPAIGKVFDLFRLRRGFNDKQRRVMAEHPMAYLYALRR